jgi:hypothetical protein
VDNEGILLPKQSYVMDSSGHLTPNPCYKGHHPTDFSLSDLDKVKNFHKLKFTLREESSYPQITNCFFSINKISFDLSVFFLTSRPFPLVFLSKHFYRGKSKAYFV